jgi:hypothetical protein
VFASEERALAWAREEYESEYEREHFRFLPVPDWDDPITGKPVV